MKKLLILIFPLSLFSENIILKSEKRDITFFKDNSSRNLKSDSKNSVYYIYGIKDESAKFISDGTVIVSFLSSINISKFSKDNKLELIRKNSSGTYIFRNLENIDIIEKSNKLSNLENIKIASPNWKRARGLK